MKKNHAALFAVLFFALVGSAHAAEMVAAHFYFEPAHLYVNQPFALHLEVEVSPGTELQDLSVDGFLPDNVATVSSLETKSRTQVQRKDRTVDLIHYVSVGRVLQPLHQDFSTALRATLVERRSMGFFSSLISNPGGIRTPPLHVDFQSLPSGAPAGYQGVVGTFVLTGRVTPQIAAPGDLVNVEYSLIGTGWLGNATLVLSEAGHDFKTYAPQETLRDENGRLNLRQVVIPQTTNACQFGAAHLPYFDPVVGAYRDAAAGPFALRIQPQHAAASAPAVKRFDVQSESVSQVSSGETGVAVSANHARRLMPFAGALLLAMVLTSVLYGWRPKLAVVLGVLVLVAGVYASQRWNRQLRGENREVRTSTAAHLCPAANARVLFRIAAGTRVEPCEFTEGWARVTAGERSGWIPADTLQP
jgi:hypothetical protein